MMTPLQKKSYAKAIYFGLASIGKLSEKVLAFCDYLQLRSAKRSSSLTLSAFLFIPLLPDDFESIAKSAVYPDVGPKLRHASV